MAALAVSLSEAPRGEDDPRFATCPGLRELIAGSDPALAEGRFAFWQAATGGKSTGDAALELELARDILAQRDAADAARLLRFRGPMLATASSRLRAKAQIRANGPEEAKVEPSRLDYPFRGFFALADADLRHTRFAGSLGESLRREVFISTDAVTLLPYDPKRDHVLLVEQFRMAPWIRGEARPWLIEAVAGRIDAGETPEEAARREAQEEAGITLTELFPVADYYPSPGALSEYLWSMVGLADLPEARGGLFGLESEGEDIRTHIIPFEAAMDWMAQGRLANAPLILSLLWLQRERPRLRAAL